MKVLKFVSLITLTYLFGFKYVAANDYLRLNFGAGLSQSSTGGYGLKLIFQTPSFIIDNLHFYASGEDYLVSNSYYYNGEYTTSFHNILALGFNYSKYYHGNKRLYLVGGMIFIFNDSRTHYKKLGYGGEVGIGFDYLLTEAKEAKDGESLASFFLESLYRDTNIRSTRVSQKDFFNGVGLTMGVRFYFY